MKKLIVCTAITLALLAAAGCAKPAPALPADPTFDSAGTIGYEGLTGGYTYMFNSGTVDIDDGASILLVNGEFVAAQAADDNSAYTDGIKKAETGTIPAGLIAPNAVVWIEAGALTPDKVDETLVATLKERHNACLDLLRAADFSTLSEGRLADWDRAVIDSTIATIQEAIDGITYIGQAGRYAIYSGPYTILIDTASDNDMYFYAYGHMFGLIMRADLSKPEAFLGRYYFG